MGAPQGGSPETPLVTNGSVCLQLVEDQYSLLPGQALPLWALLYLVSGVLYIVGLTVVSYALQFLDLQLQIILSSVY